MEESEDVFADPAGRNLPFQELALQPLTLDKVFSI
jgi:hypothetical protein